MKGHETASLNDLHLAFISHMVQMKAGGCFAIVCPSSFLYIPHGSDESF